VPIHRRPASEADRRLGTRRADRDDAHKAAHAQERPAEVLEALEIKPMTDLADIVALALKPAAANGALAA
jgi:hypothetical protein